MIGRIRYIRTQHLIYFIKGQSGNKPTTVTEVMKYMNRSLRIANRFTKKILRKTFPLQAKVMENVTETMIKREIPQMPKAPVYPRRSDGLTEEAYQEQMLRVNVASADYRYQMKLYRKEKKEVEKQKRPPSDPRMLQEIKIHNLQLQYRFSLDLENIWVRNMIEFLIERNESWNWFQTVFEEGLIDQGYTIIDSPIPYDEGTLDAFDEEWDEIGDLVKSREQQQWETAPLLLERRVDQTGEPVFVKTHRYETFDRLVKASMATAIQKRQKDKADLFLRFTPDPILPVVDPDIPPLNEMIRPLYRHSKYILPFIYNVATETRLIDPQIITLDHARSTTTIEYIDRMASAHIPIIRRICKLFEFPNSMGLDPDILEEKIHLSSDLRQELFSEAWDWKDIFQLGFITIPQGKFKEIPDGKMNKFCFNLVCDIFEKWNGFTIDRNRNVNPPYRIEHFKVLVNRIRLKRPPHLIIEGAPEYVQRLLPIQTPKMPAQPKVLPVTGPKTIVLQQPIITPMKLTPISRK